MNVHSLKYLAAYTLPLATLVSLHLGGLWSYTTLIEAFILIPLIELISNPDPRNVDSSKESNYLTLRAYDLLLYLMVPVQYFILWTFLQKMTYADLLPYERVGMILSMGIQCGAIGINVAHELGHRVKPFDRILARLLLMSSLYMHFIVEHNRGHHKNVATPLDPASARKNESIYRFWFRTLIGSFQSAWNIERTRLSKLNKHWLHPSNQMIQLIIIEAALLIAIYAFFGQSTMLAFAISASIGMLLLETVNYIEHYGLRRKEVGNGRYEKVQPWHSWNSDYPLGRIILFELTRHSDHHYKTSRKYQILRHLDESPQLPTGYPGMMLLSLIPPLWFRVVNPRLEQINQRQQ